jgi:hypothetical protein
VYLHLQWFSRQKQKWVGWETVVRMEKILSTVLQEAHRWRVEETMVALSEAPEGFYG